MSSGTATTGAAGPRKLREFGPSERFFWKDSLEEQLRAVVKDQTSEYSSKALLKNEMMACALQEVAAKHKQLFFFYLPMRTTFQTKIGEQRLPVERRPSKAISHKYPTIVIMKFDWQAQDQAKFWQQPQRTRYLQTGFLTNSPAPDVPLYALQYIDSRNVAVQDFPDSLVLFDNGKSMHLLQAAELKTKFGGGNNRTIAKPTTLWDKEPGDAGDDTGGERAAKRRRVGEVSEFALASTEELYHSIARFCRTSEAPFTASSLWQIMPRPDPAQAAAVGSPFGQGGSAEPQSRRGEVRNRRPKNGGGDADEGEDDAR